MIVKFLKRGNGSCKATMDYLLGKNRDREHATVLHGDPELTRQLADSLDFKNRYTVGVLSFEESDLENSIKQKIMADFEKSLLCGLDQDQYNITWIEHKDKGRLELNFVIPKIELSTGKAMNPYFDRVDRERVNAFKDLINAEYDLHDPNDPKNRQTHTVISNLPKDKKQLQEAITRYLLQEVNEGRANSRKDVLNALERDLGLSVARITSNSISIKDPTNENGRNIRLKGEIYADTFRFSQEYSAENERASRTYQADRINRISTTRTELERCVEAKRNFNNQRYNQPRTELERSSEQGANLQDNNRGHSRISVSHDVRIGDLQPIAIQENREKTGGIDADQPEYRTFPPASQSTGAGRDHAEQGRFNLDNSQERQEIGSRERDGRPTNNEVRVIDHAKQLYERLQYLVERVRAAVKRVAGQQPATDRADRAIVSSQSAIERAAREIEQRESKSTEHQRQAESFAIENIRKITPEIKSQDRGR